MGLPQVTCPVTLCQVKCPFTNFKTLTMCVQPWIKETVKPWPGGTVDWALSCTLKAGRFDSQLGHTLRVWV